MADERLITIDERDVNSGRIMEMTPSVTLSADMQITVPLNFHAYIIIDGEVVKTLRSTLKKKLVKILPSECIGKQISALYVSNRPFTAMSWGIGSLPITYDFLGGATLHVGASGTLVPIVDDPYAFFKVFARESGTVNLTECASAITSAFRKRASQVLVQMFNEAHQPIFNTEFLISELDRRINERLCLVRVDEVMPGVIYRSATVSDILVNQEDKIAMIEKFGNKKLKK